MSAQNRGKTLILCWLQRT